LIACYPDVIFSHSVIDVKLLHSHIFWCLCFLGASAFRHYITWTGSTAYL